MMKRYLLTLLALLIATPVYATTYIGGVTGIVNATSYTGADIGAQVNAAITDLGTNGGTVVIPLGKYSYSTTIQCPTTTNTPLIIEGVGMSNTQSGDATPLSKGTSLVYTGSGDAINQVITSTTDQNFAGCELRDLTVDGTLSGSGANGFHFGGTAASATKNVTISNFSGSGILIENKASMSTERFDFKNTQLYRNGVGIYWHCAASCNDSFAHGDVDVWVNSTTNQTGLLVDGGGLVQSSLMKLNGNIEVASGTLLKVSGNSNFINDTLVLGAECMTATCTRYNVASGSTLNVDTMDELGGAWSDTIAGTVAINSLAADGAGTNISPGMYSAYTLYANEGPDPNGTYQISHGSINTRKNTYTIAAGSTAAVVQNCSGIISVVDTANGDDGIYMCGGATCNFMASSRSGLTWVASTSTPAAGKASVYPNGSTYSVSNNTGASDTFGVTTICNRDSN